MAATRTLTIPGASDQLNNPSHSSVHAGHAGGWLGYSEATANQGSLGSSEVDLTNLTVTVTVPANRRIRVTVSVHIQSTVIQDKYIIRFLEDSTTIRELNAISADRTSSTITNEASAIVTPSAGSHTYKATFRMTVGSGTLTLSASATNPAFILVEDIGPA